MSPAYLSEKTYKLGVTITPIDNDGYQFIEKITASEIEFDIKDI